MAYVTLPTDSLYCPYPNPGDAHAPPAGFMGGIGWPPDQCEGIRIVDLAAAIAASLQNGQANRSNAALDRVLQLGEGGVEFIRARPHLLAFVQLNGFWCVREGMHRCVALAMLGVAELEALSFSTLRQRILRIPTGLA